MRRLIGLAVFCGFVAQAAGPSNPIAERPIEVLANPAAGFHQSYLLLTPEKLVDNARIIVVIPTPATSAERADYKAAAERIALKAGGFLRTLGMPILIPVLPRPPVEVGANRWINLYVPALSREAMLATNASMRRMDLQVLAMVGHARSFLQQERSISIEDKAVYIGFSAAGHFVSRMAVLHPERVLAVWSGGTGGHPILPFVEYSGRRLSYPVGVGDLEVISGKSFDGKSFCQVPILFVHGSDDTNASLPANGEPSDSYSYAQAEELRAILGATPLERFAALKEVYAKAGANAEFRVYHGAAHQITPQMAQDIVQFVEKCVNGAGKDQSKTAVKE